MANINHLARALRAAVPRNAYEDLFSNKLKTGLTRVKLWRIANDRKLNLETLKRYLEASGFTEVRVELTPDRYLLPTFSLNVYAFVPVPEYIKPANPEGVWGKPKAEPKLSPVKSTDLWIFPPTQLGDREARILHRSSVACSSQRAAGAYRSHINNHAKFVVQTWRTSLSPAVHFVRAGRAKGTQINARKDAPKSVWVLFDLVNGDAHSVNGHAYVFLFNNREDAANYKKDLERQAAQNDAIIEVSAPVHFVQA
jgi:hypothetical protein